MKKQTRLVCELGAADACAVELPIVYGLAEADGGFSPEGLANNCNGAFNPARSAPLESLYTRFQAEGCKESSVPLREYADAGVCVQAPTGYTSPTGYICRI